MRNERFRMIGNFCCEKFKEEYESECIRHDREIFKYSGDHRRLYYLMFEGNIASAPLVFCPYCGQRLIDSIKFLGSLFNNPTYFITGLTKSSG